MQGEFPRLSSGSREETLVEVFQREKSLLTIDHEKFLSWFFFREKDAGNRKT